MPVIPPIAEVNNDVLPLWLMILGGVLVRGRHGVASRHEGFPDRLAL